MMQEVNYFLDSLKSQRTKQQYAYHLDRFQKWAACRGPSFIRLLDHDNSMRTQSVIEYLTNMRAAHLSSSYRNLAMAAIKHFYEMNDIVLNWKKISKFIGEKKLENDIRGYTHEEIQKLIDVADVKYKAVILTLASTGMRREALTQIKPEDMEYLEDYQLYKIKIYRRTKWEQICFTTPEAANAIKLHMQSRNRRYFHDVKPQAVSDSLRNLAVKAALAQVQPDTETTVKGKYRGVVPSVHGLRKFAITQMAKAKVDTEIAKLLTGHSIGVRSRYLNYTDDDLLQEYLKAVDLLTINEENRLRRKVDTLEKKDGELEKVYKRLQQVETFLERLNL